MSYDVKECLNNDACATKGKAQNVKATRIYAVRANFNKLLDVARETYKENIDDIHQRE
jgi:DNA mismatch repair protein MSH4